MVPLAPVPETTTWPPLYPEVVMVVEVSLENRFVPSSKTVTVSDVFKDGFLNAWEPV